MTRVRCRMDGEGKIQEPRGSRTPPLSWFASGCAVALPPSFWFAALCAIVLGSPPASLCAERQGPFCLWVCHRGELVPSLPLCMPSQVHAGA